MTDILHKLQAIQQRRLVTQLCDEIGKPRAWFYRALRGQTSSLCAFEAIDRLLVGSRNPIAEIRDEKNLSQADLAKLLGVTRQTVSTWERRPTPERVALVTRTLDPNAGDNKPQPD